MISKEVFVETIEQLEDLDNRMDAVDSAMKDLNPDFCGFYVTDVFDVTINLLEEVFNDKENGWLAYFIYERDLLHNFKLGDVTINDEPVEINNWENVYDFLISCMEEDNV